MKRRDALSLFFELTCNDKDSLIYLNNYRSISPEKFAIIYIDSLSIIEMGESFFYDLRILQQLRLYPVIYLDEDSFAYIEVFYKNLLSINKGSKANSVAIHKIENYDEPLNEVIKFIKAGQIPFWIKNIDEGFTDGILKIINKLHSQKFLYLSSENLFTSNESSRPISLINIQRDMPELLKNNRINDEDINLLYSFKTILEESDGNLKSISITTPLSLFKELFTVNGKGTFIKKGSSIKIVEDMKNIDIIKLRSLLDASFGKKINDEFIYSKFDSVILEENYRGAAILKKSPYGMILSKFAVDEIARGEGIGRDIWDLMKENHSVICWRAKFENPINKWYAKECDGMCKMGKWNIYWINLELEKIPFVCNYLNSLPSDFYEIR